MGAKATKKYDGKHGLMPGFKFDPEKERALGEQRYARKEQVLKKQAMRRLQAQGFVLDDFTKHIKNLTGRKIG